MLYVCLFVQRARAAHCTLATAKRQLPRPPSGARAARVAQSNCGAGRTQTKSINTLTTRTSSAPSGCAPNSPQPRPSHERAPNHSAPNAAWPHHTVAQAAAARPHRAPAGRRHAPRLQPISSYAPGSPPAARAPQWPRKQCRLPGRRQPRSAAAQAPLQPRAAASDAGHIWVRFFAIIWPAGERRAARRAQIGRPTELVAPRCSLALSASASASGPICGLQTGSAWKKYSPQSSGGGRN